MAFSPDGRLLAFGGHAGVVHVWDFRMDRTEHLTGHSRPIIEMAFTPDGKQLATASGGLSYRNRFAPVTQMSKKPIVNPFSNPAIERIRIVVFDIQSRQIVLRVDASGFYDVTFSADARCFAGLKFAVNPSTTWPIEMGRPELRSAIVQLCQADTGKVLSEFSPSTTKCALSPDGKYLLTAFAVWNVSEHRVVRDISNVAAFTDGGRKILITVSGVGLPRDGIWGAATRWVRLRYVDLRTGRERDLGTFVDNGLGDAVGFSMGASSQFSPDGHFAVDHQLRLWRVPQ
jgi:hypothetical protein